MKNAGVMIVVGLIISALAAGSGGRAAEKAPDTAADISGRVETSAGAWSTHEYSGRVRAALERFAAEASGGYRSSEGYRTNDEAESWNADAGVEFMLGAAGTLKPGFDYDHAWREHAGYKDGRTPRADSNDDTWTARLVWVYRGATARLAYRDTDMKDEDPDQGLDSRVRERSWGPQVEGTWSRGREASFDYGAGYEWAEIFPDRGDRQAETRAWAQVRETLTPWDAPLEFAWGVRADSYSAFGDVWSPEARLRFGNHLFYLEGSYQLVATAPSVEQRFRRTSYALPNHGLDLERSNDFRFTIFSDAYDSPTVKVSFFMSEIEDAIVPARMPGPAGVYRNDGRATSRGMEFYFAMQAADGLRVIVTYTYEEARDEDRDRWLPGRPRHQARVKLVYRPIDDLKIVAESSYVSPSFTFADNSRQIADYYLTDLSAEYTFQDVVFTARIGNLFNRPYDYGLGFPGPPLTWIVGMRYEW